MHSAHFLALAAAFSWTLASLFGHRPAYQLGSATFNRLRMLAASLLLTLMIIVSDRNFALADEFWLPVLASGFIGVVLGDYFLFVTMRRLGPRRTGILFAANAPLAALLGWLLLNEPLALIKISAILLGFGGICLAVIYGKRRDLLHIWEAVTPPLWLGLLTGFLAALGQALGVLLLRPVMAAGADPLVVTFVRVAAACLCFWALWPFRRHPGPMAGPAVAPLIPAIAANAFFGVSFGVFLLLKALESGAVADVTILSSISPVLILPFIWHRTGHCPAWGAWLGAGLVVLSSALLTNAPV